MMVDSTKGWLARYPFILIALHLAIVLPLAWLLNIWADEGSTLYSTQHGLLNALRHAATDEKQAPLYFWLVALWRDLNGSIFFARLFSIGCSVLAIKLFCDVTRNLLPQRAYLVACAYFALHPFLIWASVEIRVYSMVILLSVLLVRLYQKAFDERGGTPRSQQVLFLLTAVVALYTNYYLGFLLAALFAGLLVRGRWRAARDYCVAMLFAGAAFTPLLLAIRSQFKTNTSGYQEPRSLFEGLQNLWHHFLTFIMPAGIFPDSDSSPVLTARVWIVRVAIVILVAASLRYRKHLTSRTLLTGTVVFTIYLGLLAAYFLLGSAYVEIRHTSVLFVPLILFSASLLADLFGSGDGPQGLFGRLALAGGSALMLGAFSYSFVTLYPNLSKRGDWARIGQYIEQNETSGQPILVFTTMDALSLPYHYHGVNQVLPDERFFEFEQEAAFGSEDSLRRQTDFAISEIPPGASEIWLVVNEKCIITDACMPLENFVRANYTIVTEKDFYLERLYLLKRKP